MGVIVKDGYSINSYMRWEKLCSCECQVIQALALTPNRAMPLPSHRSCRNTLHLCYRAK